MASYDGVDVVAASLYAVKSANLAGYFVDGEHHGESEHPSRLRTEEFFFLSVSGELLTAISPGILCFPC